MRTDLVITGGGFLAAAGLVLEFVAILAMRSRRIRSSLALKSPFALQALGFFVLAAGLIVYAIGSGTHVRR